MTATTPKRGKPWALLAVLGGIGVGTVGMCGLGAHLLVRFVRAATAVDEAGRGPLEVRSEAYRVVMRRSAEDTNVELFEGSLAQDVFQNAIFRRVESSCDVRLRVRTVGPTEEVVPWIDFVTGATPEGEPVPVHIDGLDAEAQQRRFVGNNGVEFVVIGFVRGSILYTLDFGSDGTSCVARTVASLEVLEGEALPTVLPPQDVTAPTFRMRGNRFEGFVSGLVVDAPTPFRFAAPDVPDTWIEGDEVVLLHPNGTELHIVTSRRAEGAPPCTTPLAEDGARLLNFAGAPRDFLAGPIEPHWWATTWYCVDQTWIAVTAHGPSEGRTEEAIQAFDTPLRREANTPRTEGTARRAGGADWSFDHDVYSHFPSGMTWHRPTNVDVQLRGIVGRRDNYPEPQAEFAFLRRDLTTLGVVWAHSTALPSADYHAALVAAASTDHERTEPTHDEPVHIGNCTGTRSELVHNEGRTVVVSCVQNGWAVAMQVDGITSAAETAFANEVIGAMTIGAPTDAATFHVDGATADVAGECASSEITQGSLHLQAEGCRTSSPVTALARTATEADLSRAFGTGFGHIRPSRIFASTTPLTHIELSGFPGEERRLVIGDRALRVYTVVVDSTAYVISIRGPASTSESAWSEVLAAAHIDP